MHAKCKRWYSCNILHSAPDANRLWQFDAKSGALNREASSAPGQQLPAAVSKSWTSLWQPRLNVAWLPPENIFLRVIELPKSSFGETLSMVELQLEKLSPVPVTQIVWTLEILPQSPAENLQTVIVVIVERNVVEEFLGKLETQGFLADRLEAPMLDQLAATDATEDGAWVFPALLNGQNAALVAWWFGGALRNLSYIVLPAEGDRAKSLQAQLAQLAWAGELEGWLTAQPKWHLVAAGGLAGEWETFLRTGLGEPVQVTPPVPVPELAAHTARRAVAAADSNAALMPAEFSARYREQFFDRLWLHGLFATGVLYAACVVIYFCATTVLGYQTNKVEQQVASLSGSYTNALELKASYMVLKERQDLKYAALDCWKLVADLLPPGITLQRFSFGDGHQLSLNGTVASDQITQITDFFDALRKAELNGQPMFNVEGGDQQPTYRQSGTQASWNFSLELRHTEADAP
jgi:hypothetical protein